MKKIMLVVVILLTLVLVVGFTSGCKKVELEEFSWEFVEGTGSYSAQTNSSSINLSGFVTITQPRIVRELLKANILDWRYFLLEGETPVWVISPYNYSDLLGGNFPNLSGWQDDTLWVQLQADNVEGDIFNGTNPDVMEISLAIEDEKGNLYNVGARAPFTFVRQ